MRRLLLILCLLTTATIAQAAETIIVYDFSSESVAPDRAPRPGSSQTTSTIDGPRFRNIQSRSQAVELSDDDGRTTYFGAFRTTPHTPLGDDAVADGPGNLGPISGAIEDEQIEVGPPSQGPMMFGMPTHVYTVDYRYRIAVRIARVTTSRSANEEHYEITAADTDKSSAALRVALSRGYGHAVAKHAEAFVGLPLRIEGTLKSGPQTVTMRVEATSLVH
jgi:hypothetical protein